MRRATNISKLTIGGQRWASSSAHRCLLLRAVCFSASKTAVALVVVCASLASTPARRSKASEVHSPRSPITQLNAQRRMWSRTRTRTRTRTPRRSPLRLLYQRMRTASCLTPLLLLLGDAAALWPIPRRTSSELGGTPRMRSVQGDGSKRSIVIIIRDLGLRACWVSGTISVTE